MSRRRADPRELAAVLERLERLRVGITPNSPDAGAVSTPAATVESVSPVGSTTGWTPADPDFCEPAETEPLPFTRPAPRTAVARSRADGRLVARVRQLSRACAFDPSRSGLAVLAAIALMAALGGVWYFVTARPAAGSATPARQVAASATAGAPTGPANGVVTGSGPPAAELMGWPTPTAGSAPGSPGTPSSGASAASIVVDVVGKVAAPGVVELAAGARVRDAVEAAGGALPGTDLTALNLASKLTDGQEIFVGIPVPSGPGAQAAGGVVGGDADGSGGSGGGTSSDGAGSGGGSSGGGSSSGIVDLNAASLTDLETLPGVGPVLAQHIVDWRTQHGHFTAVSQLQQVPGIGPAKYAALVSRVRV